jgi:DNA-binding NtrC family response regulator
MKTRRVDSLNEIFTTETLAILRRYRWIGNVRELKNLTEYLSHIYTGDKICKEDLHSYILEDAREEIKSEPVEDWILRMLDSYSQVPVGRKRLLTLAVDAGYDLGEGQLRSILDRLKDQGLVETVRNKGMILSDKGRQTK